MLDRNSRYSTASILESIKLFRAHNIFDENYDELLKLLDIALSKNKTISSYDKYALPEIVYSLVRIDNLDKLKNYIWNLLFNPFDEKLNVILISLQYINPEDMVQYCIAKRYIKKKPLRNIIRILDQV